MSDIVKDINKVWERIFQQKGFLEGEINFILREFEEKRTDNEVDNLFKCIENITDIKDTQTNRLNELANEKVIDANQQLRETLNICSQFPHLEQKFKENNILEEGRRHRKERLEKATDEVTSKYEKINSEFETKQSKMVQHYKSLEEKLIN